MLNKIKQTIVDSYRIGYKDLTDFARDRMMLVSFIIMPLFMMIMMGYIFPSQGALQNIPVGVVNQDTGSLGAVIVEPLSQMKVDESQQKPFNLTSISSIDDAIKQIKSQQLNGALVIPEDFTSKIMSGEQGTITIITDQSNPQVSSLLTTMMEGIIEDMSTQAGAQKVASLLPQILNPEAIVRPFVVKTEGIVPGKPNYFEFMAPGIMCMVVMFAVMMGLAASIAREKEDGTLDGILVAGTFSTGMKQRINVARALLHQPDILFLDEPTLGLDPQTTRSIHELIQELSQQGMTIMLTTHIMSEAELLSKRVAIIDHGKIASLDTPARLKRIISSRDTTILDIDIASLSEELIAQLKNLDCVTSLTQKETYQIRIHTSGEAAIDRIVNTIHHHNGQIRAINTVEPTLEDVFLHLTGHGIRDEATEKMPSARGGHHRRRATKRVR